MCAWPYERGEGEEALRAVEGGSARPPARPMETQPCGAQSSTGACLSPTTSPLYLLDPLDTGAGALHPLIGEKPASGG